MAADDSHAEHPLDVSLPSFLGRLDSDPARARVEFAEFAWRLVASVRPRAFDALGPDRREDLIQEAILHCLARDCRALRAYKPQPGTAFAAWLVTVLSHRAWDVVRSERRPAFVTEPLAYDAPARPDAESDPLARAAIARQLAAMGEKCRLLLLLWAEGGRPAEIADIARRALGLDGYTNKQASDDLRHCRRGLRERLEAEGIGPAEREKL